jgi:hypothetical protein
MFDHAVEERFLKTENRALVLARDKPADLLQALEEWHPRTLRNGWTGGAVTPGGFVLAAPARSTSGAATGDGGRGSPRSALLTSLLFPVWANIYDSL